MREYSCASDGPIDWFMTRLSVCHRKAIHFYLRKEDTRPEKIVAYCYVHERLETDDMKKISHEEVAVWEVMNT